MRPSHSLITLSTACMLAAVATQTFAQQNAPSSTPSSSLSVSADHPGVSQRDLSSGATTALNQPNDKADIKLAAAVRRAIVKDKALSVTAHNVKLIAAQGVVTLRGPVESADEKARVEADVKAVPGVSRVDNQLDAQN